MLHGANNRLQNIDYYVCRIVDVDHQSVFRLPYVTEHGRGTH